MLLHMHRADDECDSPGGSTFLHVMTSWHHGALKL